MKTTLPYLRGSILKMGCRKLICLCENARIFLIPKVLALGQNKVLIFMTVFFKLSTFRENYACKSELLDSIEITGSVYSFCISGCALFFHTKSYDSQKGQIFDLLIFCGLFSLGKVMAFNNESEF